MMTDLFGAIEANDVARVKSLLKDEGLDLNVIDRDGNRALHVAARNGHSKIVKLLLQDKKVKPNVTDWDGKTALYIAAENGRTKIVDILLKDERLYLNSYSVDGGDTALHVAVKEGHIKIVKLLLDDVRLDPNLCDRFHRRALHLAAENGRTEILALLLRDGRVEIPYHNKGCEPILYHAAEGGHTKMMKLLLRDGRVDPNVFNSDGKTAFYIAAEKGHAEIVKLLLQDDRVRINLRYKNITPLHAAVIYNRLDAVKVLLENPMVDFNSHSKARMSPLITALSQGNCSMITLFLTHPRIKISINVVEKWFNIVKKDGRLDYVNDISQVVFKKGIFDGNICAINIGLGNCSEKERLLTTILIPAQPYHLLEFPLDDRYYSSAIGETAFTFAVKTRNIEMLNSFFSNISTKDAQKYLEIPNEYKQKPLDIARNLGYRDVESTLYR